MTKDSESNGSKHSPNLGGWVGLRAGLDTETIGKMFDSAGDRTPLVRSVIRHCTDRTTPAFIRHGITNQNYTRDKIMEMLAAI
jgi:hypothetical protein